MDGMIIREFASEDRDWLHAQHAFHYARDEGFDSSFGALVGEILDDFIANSDRLFDRGWIAEDASGRLGSIFCVRVDDRTAQLRIFFLLPEARGRGLGRRLLQTCVDHATQCGFERMVLWTHESHAAACALYKATGWQLTDSTPGHSFGQDVVVQNWQLPL